MAEGLDSCMFSPPPPLPLYSNKINDLIKSGLYTHVIFAASVVLLLLLLWQVGQAFGKRLWLLPSHPSRLLALHAGTLAMLGLVAKPPPPGDNAGLSDDDTRLRMLMEVFTLLYMLLICAFVGAFMPSVAAASSNLWSNVVGVGVLIMSVNFVIFLQFFYIPDGNDAPNIFYKAREHEIIMGSMLLILLVLIVQAMAVEATMSDTKAIVLQRLEQLRMEAKPPGYKASVQVATYRPWSWEVVEHNTRIKLMMVLTSNPQNVMARSPSAAIVGALVLLPFLIFRMIGQSSDALLVLLLPGLTGLVPGLTGLQGPSALVCGFICVWRWVRVSLQEDRSFCSLVFDKEPSYWRRKVNNFRRRLKAGPRSTRPNALEEGRYGFEEVLYYTTAILMLCFVVPFHRILVAMIRFTHILSALIMQKLVWLPVKSLGSLIRRLFGKGQVVNAAAENFDNSLGVVCLEGEDDRIVGREFASAANRIIRRQLKEAKKKSDLKALLSLLESFKNLNAFAGKSKGILDVLNQDGAPYVKNLHMEHGDQFGWSLTLVSLLALMTNIEVSALGESTISEATMNAYWEAMEMIEVVDEQFVPCIAFSKETYCSASACAWSKLQKKKRRWKRTQARSEVKLDIIEKILKATLEPTEKHMVEFNKTKSATICDSIFTTWSQQTVMAYTMHTVCQNMLRHWTDIEAASNSNSGGGGEESSARKMIEVMVEHMNSLIAEILVCCLSNLLKALDFSMTEATISGNQNKIEKGLVLVSQGQTIWKELQWPILQYPTNNGLGQLRHWIGSG